MTSWAGQDSRPACTSCGEQHETDQEYCLECGARLFHPPAPPEHGPLWAWTAVVVLATIAIISGVIVAVLATRGDSASAAGAEVVAVQAPAPAPVTTPPPPPPAPAPEPIPPPETIALGPELDEPPGPPDLQPGEPSTGQGAPSEDDVERDPLEDLIDPIDDPPPPPPSDGADWPAGRTSFTVIIASVPTSRGRAQADQTAQRARSAGLSGIGVLESSNFSSLLRGYWVVFSGSYDTLDQARVRLSSARSAGFPTAYTRRVSP